MDKLGPAIAIGARIVERGGVALGLRPYLIERGLIVARIDFVEEIASLNVSAVRGDLLKQIVNLNNGIYLDEDIRDGGKTKFCIGVAGYPEKHFESPNLEIDMQRLKEKVCCGAEYIMTQMFFDNQKFFDFVKKCRENDINIPIIPGLKPITSRKQLSILPRIFHVDIPTALSEEIMRCKTDDDTEKVGTEWLIEQSKELKKFGVPVLHYYTLGKPRVIKNVVKELV